MDSDHVLVLFLGLVLVGAAVALAYSSPAVFGGDTDGIGGASLASFETTDVYCGDPNSTSGSTLSRDIRGGEALVFNQSVPVPSNDTNLSASFEQFGPQRYLLEISRETPEPTPTTTPPPTPDTETGTATPVNATGTTETANGTTETTAPANTTTAANETATETPTPTDRPTPTPTPTETGSTCHREIRYNATIHLAQPDEYTVVVTYDGELIAAHWQEGSDGGSFDRFPEQPTTAGGRNETAAAVASVRRPPE